MASRFLRAKASTSRLFVSPFPTVCCDNECQRFCAESDAHRPQTDSPQIVQDRRHKPERRRQQKEQSQHGQRGVGMRFRVPCSSPPAVSLAVCRGASPRLAPHCAVRAQKLHRSRHWCDEAGRLLACPSAPLSPSAAASSLPRPCSSAASVPRLLCPATASRGGCLVVALGWQKREERR